MLDFEAGSLGFKTGLGGCFVVLRKTLHFDSASGKLS